MISIARTVDPTVEPVTLDEVKLHCRVDPSDTSNDTWFAMAITAARAHAEKQTNRAFLQQTWRMSLDRFPGYQPWNLGSPFAPVVGRQFATEYVCGRYMQPPLLLPKPRLIGINDVKYIDISGNLQTMDPSTFVVGMDSEPATIFPVPFTWWPATIWGRPDAVQVTYTAGYGTTEAAVPANIRLAILGLIGHWYENRESVVLTNSTNAVTTIPQFVDALLADEAFVAFTYED